MNIDINELAADAAVQKSDQGRQLSLKEVTVLAENLQKIEAEIAKAEEWLEIQKKAWRELAEKTLPEAFHSLGISSLGLTNGSFINLQEVISASINDENRGEAHGWLRDNGYGDLIKNEVVVSFGKGEDEEAQNVINKLQGYNVFQQEKVHPSTLKAFVKERLKSGEPFPADTFKLFVGVAARVNKKGK